MEPGFVTEIRFPQSIYSDFLIVDGQRVRLPRSGPRVVGCYVTLGEALPGLRMESHLFSLAEARCACGEQPLWPERRG